MKNKTYNKIRIVRKIVQLVILIFFILLPFIIAGDLSDIFFRINPLTAIASMIAGRSLIARVLPAIAVIVLTVVFGRVWCGWLCPMGTVVEIAGRKKNKKNKLKHDSKFRKIKYILLIIILFAALFGNLTLLLLDPIVILSRTINTVVMPALNQGITDLEVNAYNVELFKNGIAAFEKLVRGNILSVKQHAFNFSIGISIFFIIILLPNIIVPGFWCRYLCPLGGLLAIISKISIFRRKISSECTDCHACEKVCKLGAIDSSNESTPEECTVCMDCFVSCTDRYTFYKPDFNLHLSGMKNSGITRRDFLFSLAGTAIGISLLNSELIKPANTNRLIRPPGVNDESEFLSKCIRCSTCINICPTGGLQPALLEAGLKSIGTPFLLPRIGHCEYNCNACGYACPTSAIPPLTLEKKHKKVMGIASINRSLCMPWAHGIPCIVCEEVCPVPEKAIQVREELVINTYGEEVLVQKPRVLPELCIGCGICEYKCPLIGEAAIRVFKGF